MEMFTLTNFVQNTDFELSHLQKVGEAATKRIFYSFEFPLLWALGENYFKA